VQDFRRPTRSARAISLDLARIAEAVQVELNLKFRGSAVKLFLNPEYGERMGDVAELEGTYARIGDFLKKKCQGYTGYIFTGNLDLAKKIGLKAKRRIEFYSAKLDCRLLEYELYAGSKEEKKKQ